ncbi:MAG: asparagine synthase (glutamine-hydrolyzing) [Lautropia sp.]
MCGFVVLVRLGQPPDAGLLAQMAATLEHRGPDAEGTCRHGTVAMHHKRLSIIDASGGRQPMVADGVALCFNGEIYNYVELKRELEALGHRFTSASDTEVLLRSYLQWGDDCVARFDGMFAFVLHDRRRNRLFAARDHFGIKPLYRLRVGDTLIYSSEIKAILRHPAAPRALDPVGLEDYLSLQFVLPRRTLFTGIEKLDPAHCEQTDLLTLDGSARRYWQPDFDQVETAPDERALDEVAGLLHASIDRQIRSDVPIGAYLSGGLDSSFVAAAASRRTGGRLATFTGAFHEGPEYDETGYADELARHIGADAHTIYPTDRDFVDVLPDLIYCMDEPAAGPGLFPQFMVSRAARRHVKVCLGGQGGDEIFVGYARYLIGALEEALLDTIQGKPATENTLSLGNLEHCLSTLKTYLPLLSRSWGQGIDAPSNQRYFRILNRLDASADLLTPDLRAQMARSQVRERFSQIFDGPKRASHLKRMLHFDLVANLPTLLQVEDRASMAASLESRVPLLDRALVERVARLPDRTLLSGGFSKAVLRRAARGLLPERVLNRTDKMGFPVPLQRWIKGPAHDFVADILLSRRARERGIFCPNALERLIGNEMAFGRSLWGALQIELWHRTFIDRDSSRIAAADPAPPVAAIVAVAEAAASASRAAVAIDADENTCSSPDPGTH